MKRVARLTEEPAVLREFRVANPNGTWKEKRGSTQPCFKSVPDSPEVFTALAVEQGYVCAYCEIRIDGALEGQVEHFVPECNSTEQCNFALDWRNMVACCEGGTRRDIPGDRWEEPIADTQHCGQLKGDLNPANAVVDPRELPASPCLWTYGSDGSITPDEGACALAGLAVELARTTVRHLGLDRKGLRRLRKAIRTGLEFDYLVLTDELGLSPADAYAKIAVEQLPPQDGRLPRFWSCIRHFVGEAGERFVEANKHGIPGLVDRT